TETASVVDRFRGSSITAEVANNDRVVEIAASASDFNRLPQGSVISVAGETKNDHPAESGALARWFGKLTQPVAQLAHSVDSLITPAAHAEALQAARNQKSDVRLNHARSVRASNSGAVTSALDPAPFAPCGPVTATHICVDIGTLHAGDSVQISFSATV